MKSLLILAYAVYIVVAGGIALSILSKLITMVPY